jgi:hypothetical protein
MDNLQTLTTMGTRNIGPRQAHKKLPHQNAEKTKKVIIMIGCCLAPSKYFVSNIIARTSYF